MTALASRQNHTSPILGSEKEENIAPRCAGSCWFATARVLLAAALVVATLDFGADDVWGSTALLVVAVLILQLWALGTVRLKLRRVVWSPLYIPLGLFVALGAFQFVGRRTIDPIATREALLRLTTDLIVFFVTVQLFSNSGVKLWRAFGFMVTLFGSMLSIFSIVQFVSGDRMLFWNVDAAGPPFGLYFNPDHYAGLMELLIPLTATYVVSRSADHPARIMLPFTVLLEIISLLLSGSRGGLVSLLAESVLWCVVAACCMRNETRRWLMTAAGVALVIAAGLFVWIAPAGTQNKLATVAHSEEWKEEWAAGRVRMSMDALRIFRDFPLLGTGLGSFETAYPGYQSEPTDLVVDHAHDDYAEALSESGVTGGVLIITALAMFFSVAFRHLRKRLEHEQGWIQLGATIGCCGLLVHSLMDFNFRIPANAAWFAVFAGLACAVA